MEKDQKKYELDPSTYAIWVMFADGIMARMVKGMHDEGEAYKFYLVPTKDVQIRYGEELKKKATYDSVEDFYEHTIHKSKCIMLDPHPNFQKWIVLVDWAGKDRNPINARMDELIVENKRLQDQRDAYSKKIASQNRQLSKFAKYPSTMRREIMKEVGQDLKEVNVFSSLSERGA